MRLGLVFNGGISLAVWMGGVTHEIDAARRAHQHLGAPATSTSGLYRELLWEILGQRVRVDVIAGASAGGINGALLAAAIASGKPMAGVRNTWMTAGDISSLLRSSLENDPPSLLQGDGKLLPTVREKLGKSLDGERASPDHPLYLYITATNLFGRESPYRDATQLEFTELDSRHTFSFESRPPSQLPAASQAPTRGGTTRPSWPSRLAGPTPFGHKDVADRLARAARSSSSFPVAFEVSGPLGSHKDYFIDGGVLDNQPFAPLLDRIGVLPAADYPVKRVVGYVVPYVQEVREAAERHPTALKTATAGILLPRGLPKLQSLDRVTAAAEAQRADEAQRHAIYKLVGRPAFRAKLGTSASDLFDAYRATRAAAAVGNFASWNAVQFVPGSGRAGQDPTIAVADIAARTAVDADAKALERPWVPVSSDWSPLEPRWRWGLSPAERVATWALLVLRDALEDSLTRRENASLPAPKLTTARNTASQLVWDIRELKRHASENFAFPDQSGLDVAERAAAAYEQLRGPDSPDGGPTQGLHWLQQRFAELDSQIAEAAAEVGAYVPAIRTLLHVEVVRNALSVNPDAPPFPFDFVFMSAGIQNSLGHPSTTPDLKLAGMKLGHFGAFLKSSWRANDWLWGRLDGVEHLLRATFDRHLLKTLSVGDASGLAADLATFAFPDDAAVDTPSLATAWQSNCKRLGMPTQACASKAFEDALVKAIADDDIALEACRCALAARIQLTVLAEELDDVAAAARDDVAHGSRRSRSGARWARALDPATKLSPDELVKQFHAMEIGAETLPGELGSRAGVEVLSRALAVAAAVLAGRRGKLSLPLRLVVFGPLRLLALVLRAIAVPVARRPALTAIVLVALLVYALVGR